MIGIVSSSCNLPSTTSYILILVYDNTVLDHYEYTAVPYRDDSSKDLRYVEPSFIALCIETIFCPVLKVVDGYLKSQYNSM